MDPGGQAAIFERERRQIGAAVSICFVVSGSTALVYEVVWTRMLGLVFGQTVFAITTVLAAFMAGLGLGSWLFGRIADRSLHRLRLYGLLEIGIGAYALLTPTLFRWAESVYIPLRRAFELSFFAFSFSQFVLIFCILVVPATLMGATLPVLTRFFVREIAGVGGQVGRLYALNTFGAVLGTYFAGFHLIPLLGLRTTLLLAGVANAGIGVLAVVFDRHLAALPAPSPEPVEPAAVSPALPEARRSQFHRAAALAVIGLGVSGAASMMYEVAWTRALALVIGSSTYAFSTMLVTFLAGLALGSGLFARLARRLAPSAELFGLLQLFIGLSALLVTPFFDRMPELFVKAFRVSQDPAFISLLQFGISVLAMLLPTLFIGGTFPCVAHIASPDLERVGRDVGRVYVVNTAGAIAGVMAAGFLLIPWWGLQATLKVAAGLNLVVALLLFLGGAASAARRGGMALAPLTALALLVAAPAWDLRAMASGVAIYGRSYFRFLDRTTFREAVASLDKLLFYEDGIGATVSVHEAGGRLYLRVNGKTDASSSPTDMHTQVMLGHLPLLHRPDAERVLVIGLGSGVTAGAVARHPVRQVDVIEIEPAVIRAAGFFSAENRDVLRHPRVRVSVADGRNFLLAAEQPYDVIISEPSNPWIRGIGSLFSLEFYQLAARKLSPGGVMCQWIHIYNLQPDDLRMVVRTFRSAFPHTTVWAGMPGDLLLIGSARPQPLHYAQVQTVLREVPGVRDDLARLGLHSPAAVLADFLLTEGEAARYGQNATLNTDDLPLLEFSAPVSLYADTMELNRRLLVSYREDPIPPIPGLREAFPQLALLHRELGLAYLAKEMPEEAARAFQEALRLDPNDPVALLERSRALLQRGLILQAEADLKALAQRDPHSAEPHDLLAQLYSRQQLAQLADAHLRRAAALAPRDPRFLLRRADLAREQGRFAEALAHYQAAEALAPLTGTGWLGLGLTQRALGRTAEALRAFKEAQRTVSDGSADYQLGVTFAEAGRDAEAQAAFEAAARRSPLRPDAYLGLGRLHFRLRDAEKALEAFEQVLRLEPGNVAALRGVDDSIALTRGAAR